LISEDEREELVCEVKKNKELYNTNILQLILSEFFFSNECTQVDGV